MPESSPLHRSPRARSTAHRRRALRLLRAGTVAANYLAITDTTAEIALSPVSTPIYVGTNITVRGWLTRSNPPWEQAEAAGELFHSLIWGWMSAPPAPRGSGAKKECGRLLLQSQPVNTTPTESSSPHPESTQYFIDVPAQRSGGQQQFAVVTAGSLVSRLIPARGFLANALAAARVAATVIQDDAYTLVLLNPPAAPDMCARFCSHSLHLPRLRFAFHAARSAQPWVHPAR